MTELLQTALLALLGGVGITLRMFVQARLTPARLDGLAAAARTVVIAADQAGENNADKFQMAANGLNAIGKRLGFRKLKPEELQSFIEAAVAELRSYGPPEFDMADFPTPDGPPLDDATDIESFLASQASNPTPEREG